MRMDRPTAQEHGFVVQLVEEAIAYHKAMSDKKGAVKSLEKWLGKYDSGYKASVD